METDRQTINKIIAHRITGSIKPAEQQVLDQWLLEPGNKEHYDEIADDEHLLTELRQFYQASKRAKKINARILKPYQKKGGIIRIMDGWRKYAAAACIVAVVTLLYIYVSKADKQQVITTATNITPGAFASTLTLANGRTIKLDNKVQGKLLEVNNTIITNNNNTLSYVGAGTGTPAYNQLTTAKGQTYTIVLSDGTTAWLNSASSLRYPVAFEGNERKVEITGEVYFEVAKNEKMPFKVVKDKMEVEVLGTHFNINAYTDEPVIQTTLLEGKVRIRNGNNERLMSPGQTASISRLKDSIDVKSGVDTTQTIAWKNGMFILDNYTVSVVARQIARWYNVDVQIDGDVPDIVFAGKMPRNKQLKYVLEVLETAGSELLDFKIVDHTIIVSKKS